MRNQVNTQLVKTYQQWFSELKEFSPDLLGARYSNPYYISIPEGWFETSGPRIMVVGEEGFGTYGCGKGEEPYYCDIEDIQQLNYRYLREQLFIDSGDINNSAFWRRFRKIATYGVCCWTNIDKIHILHGKKCVLSQADRKQLHSTPTRILQEEINLLDPTHIVFFGWHGDSLKHELPALYSLLYPNGPKDNSVWNKTVVPLQVENRTYIFCYHPNWGYRNKGYEDKVMDVIRTCI